MKYRYIILILLTLLVSCQYENDFNMTPLVGDFKMVTIVNNPRVGMILSYSKDENSYLPLVDNCCQILYDDNQLLVAARDEIEGEIYFSIMLNDFDKHDTHLFQNFKYPTISFLEFQKLRKKNADLIIIELACNTSD